MDMRPCRSIKLSDSGSTIFRFEEKREKYLWIQPESILFVKSADHYIRTLVEHKNEKKWAIRHCTVKSMLSHLTHDHFVRLNRFYIINRNCFSHFNEEEGIIYLNDGYSVDISHGISRFILDVLKPKCT